VTLSHRFVGPVLRVRNALRQASRGEKTARVKLRPNDFWTELADDLNEFLDRVEAQSVQPLDVQPQDDTLVRA
jgi:hypothetical protein